MDRAGQMRALAGQMRVVAEMRAGARGGARGNEKQSRAESGRGKEEQSRAESGKGRGS
jgi:hypothetical protein